MILMAMRGAGADIQLRKGDWPKTSEKRIEAYQPEELTKFFSACSGDERVLFQVFLDTGFRSNEVSTLRWTDIDYRAGTIGVSAKPELDFAPKSYEERRVTVARALINTPRKRHKHSTPLLVFPVAEHPTRPNYGGDGRDEHMLELCKEIAFRAGLNCGRCEGTYNVKRSGTRKQWVKCSCKTHPRCRK